MASIFLSHSSKDKRFARQLARNLKANGVNVWLDEAEMLVGDSLFKKLEQAIREMEYLGVVLSPNSVGSEWVQKEVEIALNQEIQGKRVKVLPMLYRECTVPAFLVGKVWVDFSKPRSYHSGLNALIKRLMGTKSTTSTLLPASDESIEGNVKDSPQLGNPLLDAAWNAYLTSHDERRLYCLEEAAGLRHPKVKEELLRIPVNQHCLAIAKLAPFPEYVPIAMRELMTTYDQSNYSAMDFLAETSRKIPNEIKEQHLVPAVAIAKDLAEFQDNEMSTSFSSLVWFVGTVGSTNKTIRVACRRILNLIGQFDLDEWHRNELNEVIALIDVKNA